MARTPGRTATAVGIVILALGLVACAGADDSDGPGATGSPTGPAEETGGTGVATGTTGATGTEGDTTVVATEYKFHVDGSVAPGETELVLRNEGEEPHELTLMRLEQGRTIEDVEALIEEGVPDEPPPWVTPIGGTFARPGRTSDPLQADLEPGSYLMACFVTAKDGTPHAALGMIQELDVG
jgi:hypothetical protein